MWLRATSARLRARTRRAARARAAKGVATTFITGEGAEANGVLYHLKTMLKK